METLVVHMLWRSKWKDAARSVDETMRLAVPLTYVTSVLSLTLYGVTHDIVGSALAATGGLALTIGLSVITIRQKMKIRYEDRCGNIIIISSSGSMR